MKDGNPLLKLRALGQSIWLDDIHRGLIRSGELRRLIAEDGLRGLTSNPAIFGKAIEGSSDYDEALDRLVREGKSVSEIMETLMVEDLRAAADLFRPTFENLDGRDGFVSLEVNPHLARDVQGTISEARRLWGELDRPNAFIKVPATMEGLDCIRELVGEGINVNVTLLFGLARYRMVAESYIAGLEGRAARGLPIGGVASVASFFLSRIDVMVDPMLEKIAGEGGPRAGTAESLRGRVAISSAKIAYQMYKEIFGGERFRSLAAAGGRAQRVLWASTSTKNPDYPDTKYVEPLVGPDTVNTLPMETLAAYRDHGNPALRLEENREEARICLERLAEIGIDIDSVTRRLEDEGIKKFVRPFDSLVAHLEKKRGAAT